MSWVTNWTCIKTYSDTLAARCSTRPGQPNQRPKHTAVSVLDPLGTVGRGWSPCIRARCDPGSQWMQIRRRRKTCRAAVVVDAVARQRPLPAAAAAHHVPSPELQTADDVLVLTASPTTRLLTMTALPAMVQPLAWWWHYINIVSLTIKQEDIKLQWSTHYGPTVPFESYLRVNSHLWSSDRKYPCSHIHY